MMKRIAPALAGLACAAAFAASAQHAGHAGHGGHGAGAAATPYAGMDRREIKALAPEDARRLLEGQGMSLALAAELNGYPGPMHVLEHADALALDAGQRERTRALLDAHKAEARSLGAQVVEAERALDRAFAGGAITAEAVAQRTRDIALLQGELRAAHLRTHLQQTALLSPTQIAQYQRLRGYTGAGAR
jgi:hypothetical protein